MYMKIMFFLLVSLMLMMPLFETLLASVIILFTSTLVISGALAVLLSSWVSLILLLMYITGLLVIFGYMVAMSPNFTSPVTKKMKWVALLLPLFLISNFTFSSCTISFESNISHFVSKLNSPMYWLMAIILLLALLMAVSLSYKAPKTLRSFQSF